MTRQEVVEMIKTFNIPYAYLMFPVGKAPEPPYCVYYYPNDNDAMADNLNYVKVSNLRIELYTRNKDFELEDQVEAKMLLPFSKDVEYIDSEKLYQVTYESEVIING